MSVNIGDLITATQYNALRNAVNEWWGDNYASNTPSDPQSENENGWGCGNAASVAVGDDVTAMYWNMLINRISLGVTQTGAGSPLTKINIGDDIEADDYNTIETQSALIAASADVCVDHTTTTGGSDGTRQKSNWSSAITVVATAAFASYAEARYFFNSGGQLRYSFSNNGTTDDALAWADVFDADDMGTLIFSKGLIAQTGTRPGNSLADSGFYGLTTTDKELYNINLDQAPYTQNDLKVMGRRNADGTQVILTFTMNNDDPQAELVDGATIIYCDRRTPDGKSLTDPTATFSIAGPTSHSAAAWTGS